MGDHRIGPLLLCIAVLACGGKKDGAAPDAPRTRLTLRSELGDTVGGGLSYGYDRSTAQITVNATGGLLVVDILGDEHWSGAFALPGPPTALATGTYAQVTRYPSHQAQAGGMDWSGEGRGCNALNGWFAIDAATYTSGLLTSLHLRFEQHCEGAAPALHGELIWDAADTTAPPGPTSPPPDLWTPQGFTPPSGNYVHLESDVGEPIGAGRTYDYTQATAILAASGGGRHFSIAVTGDESWLGEFEGMHDLARLQPGYYPSLRGYPLHNPVRGGLSWNGEGRDCGVLIGWMAVDAVTYGGEAITSIDLRFELRCQAGGPALRGKIHWAMGDPTGPAGPVRPPPPGLWTPTGFTPPASNYIHLESDAGDSVGAGRTYDYTQANALLSVTATAGQLAVRVDGDEHWIAAFQAMSILTRLEPGYYGHLTRAPFHKPLRGGLDWWGEGRGCSTLTGWFVVDSVSYLASEMTAIDLRFEQHCEGGGPALHGAIHWAAGDPTAPPGPVDPPPAGLWTPTVSTPPAGNYVHLESDAGDPVGRGGTYDYTQADAILWVSATGLELSVEVRGEERWSSTFRAMSGLARLEPGYYGNLQGDNPARARLNWNGGSCSATSGWFVVDAVTYLGTTLTALDLRFEQHCDGGAALHGAVHWAAGDPTAPPGPVNPPPAGLWTPTGFAPPAGNYLHLESDAGDHMGVGQTYDYGQASTTFRVTASGGRLSVYIAGAQEVWIGELLAMSSLSRLEPGYYGGLRRTSDANPARGGLEWWNGRNCSAISGWFAIDAVTYAAGAMTAIDLRFQQHCDGSSAALHGALHWAAY